MLEHSGCHRRTSCQLAYLFVFQSSPHEDASVNLRSSFLSPLNAAQSLTHDGKVLCQLHHGNNDGSSSQSAGWPEQGVEDGDLAVDLCQDSTVCSVCWVHKTLNCMLRPETLRDVPYYCMCSCIVFMALWDVEALKERIEKRKTEMLLCCCLFV